jgi:hypothetical protein
MNLMKICLTLALLLITARSVVAGNRCCPECGATTCSPVCVPITEKHHCYEVQCKTICIPKISCPWEKCCTPKCGRVKTVKVLKKVDYKCEKCGCKWELNCVECCPHPQCLDIPAETQHAQPPAASAADHFQPPLPSVTDTRAAARQAKSTVENPTRGTATKTSFFEMFIGSRK